MGVLQVSGNCSVEIITVEHGMRSDIACNWTNSSAVSSKAMF